MSMTVTERPELLELLRPEDVAWRLSLGRTKVFQLIATGQLESISIGRSRRVPLAALKAFIEKLQQEQS